MLRARRSRKGRSCFHRSRGSARHRSRDREIDGFFVYNIDDFERLVADGLSGRQREAQRAEQIVLEQVLGWERWNEAAQATPTIVRSGHGCARCSRTSSIAVCAGPAEASRADDRVRSRRW
jgi:hypothetical protein